MVHSLIEIINKIIEDHRTGTRIGLLGPVCVGGVCESVGWESSGVNG